MRFAKALWFLLCALSASAADAYPGDEIYARPGKLVDIGGRHLNLYCSGRGWPTIVLESGLGGRASAWSQVQSKLSNRARVCSYDRAGYAFSDAGPEPRTASALARELHAALAQADEHGPYLLVGSTFGAFVVRMVATLYRDEVAGMVLLSPSPENEELSPASPTLERIDSQGLQHAVGCRNAAKRGELNHSGRSATECLPFANPKFSPQLNSARLEMLRRPRTWMALVGEWQAIRQSAAEVKTAQTTRFRFPLIVISSGREPEADGSRADKAALHEAWIHWAAWQDDIAKLSTHSEHIRTASADRAIESSDPSLVISAIDKLIGTARKVHPSPR